MKRDIKEVQAKILEVMKFIDKLCRENGIEYFIMGGTALGAVRHGGFIPWDDDLDIFMTPENYEKFSSAFYKKNDPDFVIQEWRTTEKYLEYAKVRMNNTTFIEESFKDRRDIHQGIYVDIMILHKVPENKLVQGLEYTACKFVTLYALSQRNWKPKTKPQKLILSSLKIIPCKLLSRLCYSLIYRYDGRKENYKYCYWITPAGFKSGLFDREFFDEPQEIMFEDCSLLGPQKIKEYLSYRYGDYMKLPSEEKRKASVHAYLWDCNVNYTEYLR